MSLSFRFYTPTQIVFSRGSLSQLGDHVKHLGDRALLVTGRHFARRYGYIDRLNSIMEGSGVRVKIFDRVEPNPSFETVEEGAKIARDEATDVIVAFGGGSAIDAAKAIALLCVQGGSIRSYIYPHVVEEEVLPIVASPTTCGTGSEVTRYSVLTDVKAKRKTVVVGYPIAPRVAIVDPEVLRHLPSDLTAYTALDAFSHAIEAYWSKTSQPISDIFALESMRIILQDLRKGFRSPEARDSLHYASLLAGLAINPVGTTAIHGMGYYLTTHFGVHHGLANAMFLPFIIELNAPYVRNKMVKLAEYVGFEFETAEEAARRVREEVLRLEDDLEVPSSLRELGVDESKMDEFVAETFSYKRNLENNPRSLSEDDVKDVFLRAFKGRSGLKG